MANIIDYVQWRGDIPLHQVPFGAVDALILSYLAYMPFDGLVHEEFGEGGMLLSDAVVHFAEQGLCSLAAMDSGKNDLCMMEALKNSERFGTLRLTGYVNRFDKESEEQFSAITFLSPQGDIYIAFRGTDSSVVGWKEDFNMSFAQEVPSQGSALDYVVRACGAFAGEITVCGHSKGGNLAAYAGIFAPENVQERIRCAYNFDGPGFNETVLEMPQFRRMDMRIHTFVPQSSMIGIIMWHAEPFIVVKSDGVGVFQHNPYSWQVMGGRFITMPERTIESRLLEETVKKWLEELSGEERKRVIDGVYSVLRVSQGRDVSELFEAKNAHAVLRAIMAMDEETKAAISDAVKRLGSLLGEVLPEWMENATEQILAAFSQRNAGRIARIAQKRDETKNKSSSEF